MPLTNPPNGLDKAGTNFSGDHYDYSTTKDTKITEKFYKIQNFAPLRALHGKHVPILEAP
jgi:hypothetical protein